MENGRNTIGIIAFFVILLVFVVGGYFAMDYFTNYQPKKEETKTEEKADLRVDKTKDYIYYENGEEIIASEAIHWDEAIFNFDTLSDINKQLKDETDEIYASIKYTKNMELPKVDSEGNEITYLTNDEGIYSLNYRDYADVKYNDYLSLVVKDYSYDILKGPVSTAIKAYVVDINTGKILSDDDLMKKFNVTLDIIKEKVRERLISLQTLGEGEINIDIEGTINSISTKAIYINKTGKLTLSFIVKSNQNPYNDSVDLN